MANTNNNENEMAYKDNKNERRKDVKSIENLDLDALGEVNAGLLTNDQLGVSPLYAINRPIPSLKYGIPARPRPTPKYGIPSNPKEQLPDKNEEKGNDNSLAPKED